VFLAKSRTEAEEAKEPAYREGVLPDASTGQHPGTPRQRGQKTVTVQDFNYWLVRVSGCNCHYKFILGVGAKQKA